MGRVSSSLTTSAKFEDMIMLTAVITSHTNGYDADKAEVKALGEIGDKFDIEHIDVGSWCSHIYLSDHPRGFNSVNFKVIDKVTGEDYDFFDDPDINPYHENARRQF